MVNIKNFLPAIEKSVIKVLSHLYWARECALPIFQQNLNSCDLAKQSDTMLVLLVVCELSAMRKRNQRTDTVVTIFIDIAVTIDPRKLFGHWHWRTTATVRVWNSAIQGLTVKWDCFFLELETKSSKENWMDFLRNLYTPNHWRHSDNGWTLIGGNLKPSKSCSRWALKPYIMLTVCGSKTIWWKH